MAKKESKGIIEIKLSRPIKYGSDEIDTISVDLTKLTGRDMLNARNIAMAKDSQSGELPTSMAYRLAILQVATGIPYDVLLTMPAVQFNKLMLAMMAFSVGEEESPFEN